MECITCKVYVFDNIADESIDRIDTYEIMGTYDDIWTLRDQKITNGKYMMFTNGDLVEMDIDVNDALIDEFKYALPEDFDILILDYNRYFNIIQKLKREIKCGQWISTMENDIDMKDIACFLISPNGVHKIQKNQNLNIWRYNGRSTLIANDNWKSGNYLDNGSPILVCNLLRKILGGASGTLAKPLFNVEGYDISCLNIVHMMFALLSGMIGIPCEWVLRFICVCYILEPIEGLVMKVIFTLLVTKLLYEYGKNPLFMIW